MPISTLSGVKENVLISDMFLQPEFLNQHRLYMHIPVSATQVLFYLNQDVEP